MVQELEICAELRLLRETGRRLRQRLRDSRRRSQEFAAQDRREAPRNGGRHTDYEAYLQRKMARTDSEIQRHVVEHRCHDLGTV